MKPLKHIALFIVLLVISIPFIHAEDLDLQYDSAGNLVTGDGLYRTYDGFNHLVQIRQGNSSIGNITEELTWHPTEERILVKKEYYSNQSLKNKIVYINRNTIKVVNSTGSFYETYVYQEAILVAQQINGQKQAIHSDHLSSVTLITNSSGDVIENSLHSAFGEILGGGEKSRFDYEAMEYDPLTQDYDFHFRRYNPYWGKFTQPDSLLPNLYNPQALNRYSFEGNDPVNNRDPTGHCPQCLLAGGAFIIGSLWYMGTHSGSGWSHVGHTYAAGAIAAGAVLGSYAFVTGAGSTAGTAAATHGADAALTIAGNVLVGAGAEVLTEMNEDEELDPTSIIISGAVSPLTIFGMHPGSPMGSKLFSVNHVNFLKQQVENKIYNYLAINLVKNSADNSDKTKAAAKTSKNNNSAKSKNLTNQQKNKIKEIDNKYKDKYADNKNDLINYIKEKQAVVNS